MSDLRFLLKVSRPRFWFYVFGPYILGLIAGATTINNLVNGPTILFALYFLLPANLLIYGVNDIFDYETDRLNDKKTDYEALVDQARHKVLIIWISLFNIPILFLAFVSFAAAWISIGGFLFFSIFYSAPPIRAKTKPFLDSAFNILYVFPGIFGYYLMANKLPPIHIIIAAGCWTAAMHAYSAIPDIEADRRAGLKTIASVLGPFGTLAICSLLYLAAAVISFSYLGFVSITLGAVYLILMAASVVSVRTGTLFKLYKAFPVINVLAGFIIFWHIALEKFF